MLFAQSLYIYSMKNLVEGNVLENSINTRHWVMVSSLGVVWGSTFLFIELALQGITPLWLTSARIVFAAAVTSVVWFAYGVNFLPLMKKPGGA